MLDFSDTEGVVIGWITARLSKREVIKVGWPYFDLKKKKKKKKTLDLVTKNFNKNSLKM